MGRQRPSPRPSLLCCCPTFRRTAIFSGSMVMDLIVFDIVADFPALFSAVPCGNQQPRTANQYLRSPGSLQEHPTLNQTKGSAVCSRQGEFGTGEHQLHHPGNINPTVKPAPIIIHFSSEHRWQTAWVISGLSWRGKESLR